MLAHDKSVRVVIIRSMLKNVFCAGADLKERATMTPVEVQRFVTSLRGLLKNIEQLPVPVISAIDGAALGGGLEMALACDIRTVSNDAKLGQSHSRSTYTKHVNNNNNKSLIKNFATLFFRIGGNKISNHTGSRWNAKIVSNRWSGHSKGTDFYG